MGKPSVRRIIQNYGVISQDEEQRLKENISCLKSELKSIDRKSSRLNLELESINRRYSRLKMELGFIKRKASQLTKQQSTIKKAISTRRSRLAPIHRIPSELLAEIFTWVPLLKDTPNNRYINRDQLFVLRVCKRWREVALSTPKLWAQLRIDIVILPVSIFIFVQH